MRISTATWPPAGKPWCPAPPDGYSDIEWTTNASTPPTTARSHMSPMAVPGRIATRIELRPRGAVLYSRGRPPDVVQVRGMDDSNRLGAVTQVRQLNDSCRLNLPFVVRPRVRRLYPGTSRSLAVEPEARACPDAGDRPPAASTGCERGLPTHRSRSAGAHGRRQCKGCCHLSAAPISAHDSRNIGAATTL